MAVSAGAELTTTALSCPASSAVPPVIDHALHACHMATTSSILSRHRSSLLSSPPGPHKIRCLRPIGQTRPRQQPGQQQPRSTLGSSPVSSLGRQHSAASTRCAAAVSHCPTTQPTTSRTTSGGITCMHKLTSPCGHYYCTCIPGLTTGAGPSSHTAPPEAWRPCPPPPAAHMH